MANKRMFTMKIVDSDAFLDMPLSTQCLYFHLNMRADDDGFIGNPKRVMKIIGASDDDLKLLIAKRFVLCFENGVIVIKHWRMHNTLSKSRYFETQYLDEKSLLRIKDNGSYSLNNGESIDDSKLIEMSERQKTNIRRTLDEQKTNPDIGLDIDKDIELDIALGKEKEEDKEKPPISPLDGGQEAKTKKDESYKQLFERLLVGHNISDYLLESINDWLAYKEERKFTYKERGLKILLNQIIDNAQKYGDVAVVTAISNSIASGYQGIVFDKIGKYANNNNYNQRKIDWSNV